MKHAQNSLYRRAQRARRALAKLSATRAQRLEQRLADVSGRCRAVYHRHSQVQRAARRGWPLTAAKLQAQLLLEIQRMQETAADFLRSQNQPLSPVPSLALLMDELRGLLLEFEVVTFKPQENQITATTEPLVLEGHHLGPFDIVLHLDRLSQETNSGCFDCVAVEPNAAESNESVTHPNVRDDALCAGEATMPIGLALAQGRLCDAFVLVAGVLRTYNAASPYVSLDDWTGLSCPECGDTCGRDGTYYCEACERDVCEECSGHCEVCDRSVCCDCLEHDQVSDKACCAHCHENCRTCKRVVDSESVDEDTHLCPACLALQTEDTNNNPEDDSNGTANLPHHDQIEPVAVG